jgi:hypothetical protein
MKNLFDRLVAGGNNVPESLDGVELSAQEEECSELRPQPDFAGIPSVVKQITQELLKYGFLEEAARADLFRHAIVNEQAVNAVLEPLDLTLRIDTMRGVAFLTVAPIVVEGSAAEEGWSHPLVRRQRLTLEQSLLIAILRQAFVMHEQESALAKDLPSVPSMIFWPKSWSILVTRVATPRIRVVS